jgi:hypothetical protein
MHSSWTSHSMECALCHVYYQNLEQSKHQAYGFRSLLKASLWAF